MTKNTCLQCITNPLDLAEEIIHDIRELFLHEQIKQDGTIKRNPRYFTPWSTRNFKYNKADKKQILYMIQDIAYINDKNIWQFTTTDLRYIIISIRQKADELVTL